MIEMLLSGLLWVALSATPALCVRDDAASLPDSGAIAVQSDSLIHASSRTPILPPVVVTLPVVHVDAALDRASRRAPTAFVTTLGNGSHDTRATASLRDALIEAAGVRVTQYGGMGAFSAMSLRGAPPGHVTVLLDGVPLTSAAHGVVDLADLPATAVEAIEVYRGAAPGSLATPTPGGAVNLLTRPGVGVRSLKLATGSFGTGEAQASWGERRGAWSLLAHGGWQGSNSDFRYWSDNGTPLEPSDDAMLRRANARFDAASALVHGAYSPSDHVQTSAHAEYFRRGQGVPGPIGLPSLTARYASERLVLATDTRVSNATAWPALEARTSLAHERSNLRDLTGDLGYGRVDTHERFADAGGSLELTSPLRWSLLALSTGAGLRAETAHPAAPTIGLPDPPASHRDTRAAWAGADVRFAGERVLLHAARRWDREAEHVRDTRSTGVLRVQDVGRTLDAPQLGARLRVGGGLEIKCNWSRAARAPEFDELFGIDGAVTGNPTLLPEHTESWDAGLTYVHTWGRLRASADWSHHATHARDLVIYVRSSPRGAQPTNVGAARLYGEESSLRVAYAGAELSATTAWLSATDRSNISFYHGRRLPQRPERQSQARLSLRRGPWLAAGELEVESDTFLDRANFARAPGRTLVGASLGRSFGAVHLLAEGRNLGDKLAQDVAGFPLPGRMFLLSLTLDLSEGHATP